MELCGVLELSASKPPMTTTFFLATGRAEGRANGTDSGRAVQARTSADLKAPTRRR